jgi:hypothetical protein
MTAPIVAFVALDAALRTAWRILVKRRLLDWRSANFVEGQIAYLTLGRTLVNASLVFGVVLVCIAYYQATLNMVSSALLVAWGCAPLLLSRMTPSSVADLNPTELKAIP